MMIWTWFTWVTNYGFYLTKDIHGPTGVIWPLSNQTTDIFSVIYSWDHVAVTRHSPTNIYIDKADAVHGYYLP